MNKKIILILISLLVFQIASAETSQNQIDSQMETGAGMGGLIGKIDGREYIVLLKTDISQNENIKLKIKTKTPDHTPNADSLNVIIYKITSSWEQSTVTWNIINNFQSITNIELSHNIEKTADLTYSQYGYAIRMANPSQDINNLKDIDEIELEITTTQTQSRCWDKNTLPQGVRDITKRGTKCKIDAPELYYWGNCEQKCKEIGYPNGYNYDMGDGARTRCWQVNTNMFNEPCYSNTHVCNSNGLCVPSDAKCSDSDDGLNYGSKGTTSAVEIKTDFCTDNVLTEYFCENNNIKSKPYNCLDEEKTCYFGACREPDLNKEFCKNTNWGWIVCDPLTKCEEITSTETAICCGDDNNEYYITSKWDNSETTDTICCDNANDKIHNNKCAFNEPKLKIDEKSFGNPKKTIYHEGINKHHFLWSNVQGYSQHTQWCKEKGYTQAKSINIGSTEKIHKPSDFPIRLASYKKDNKGDGRWQCRDAGGSLPCPEQESSDTYISSVTCSKTEWTYDDTQDTSTCTDSDSSIAYTVDGGIMHPPGEDRYVKGYTIDQDNQKKEDYCIIDHQELPDNKFVIEAICIDGKTADYAMPFECPNGCEDGACKELECPSNEYLREPSVQMSQGWPSACCDSSTDCVWTDETCYDLAHHSSLDPNTQDEYLCNQYGNGYFWDRCFANENKERTVNNVKYYCNNGVWSRVPTQISSCSLTKAYWPSTQISEGDNVKLTVEGENCQGDITFKLFKDNEWWKFWSKDLQIDSKTATFIGIKAEATWKAVYTGKQVYFKAKKGNNEIESDEINIAQQTTPDTCTDTDAIEPYTNGINFNQYGWIILSNGKIHRDKCSDATGKKLLPQGNYIAEFYCVGNNFDVKIKRCQCDDGQCMD